MPRKRRTAEIDAEYHNEKRYIAQTDEKLCNTAIYARLSSEDLGRHNEQSSCGGTIENQILLVRRYIEAKPDLKLREVFTDNGQTGTNFDRDGWQKLMENVRRGEIDCIVVKDLSRLGRNYIETGDYLEKIFPFLGVRFISVNDSYDSATHAKNGDSLSIVLKNLINDIYAKDISKKIKTAFEIKQKNGEFIGGQAPYGYKKSPSNRHKLVIDEETAPVVRDIFRWKLDGMSNIAIMRRLNSLDVPSPSNYLHSKGMLSHEKYAKRILWCRDYIGNILRNPVYIGHMAQGKSKSDLNLGIKSKPQPREDWIIVENTHEPIIDLSVFETVGNIVKRQIEMSHVKTSCARYDYIDSRNNNISDRTLQANIFAGLVYCSGCGKTMSRNRSANQRARYARFICRGYNLHFAENCKHKTISEIKLQKTIFAAIQQQMDLFTETESNIKTINTSPVKTGKKEDFQNKIQSLEQRIDRLNFLRGSLYDDYKDGVLSEKEYKYARQKHESEINTFTAGIAELSAELEKYSDNFVSENKYAAEMSRFNRFRESISNTESREMLTALIDKIIVYADNKIEIICKYSDELTSLRNC